MRESFSRDPADYNYDGVLWTSTYCEHEEILRREVNLDPATHHGWSFLEVGCKLGVITQIAQKEFHGDAVVWI